MRVEDWFLYAGRALCLFSLWAFRLRDWLRLSSLSRTVEAEVVGHRISRDNDGTSYAPIYRFSAEGGTHRVSDEVLHARAQPPIGTRATLRYPVGHPELARVPRPLMWAGVYLLLIGLLAVLVAKKAGWLVG